MFGLTLCYLCARNYRSLLVNIRRTSDENNFAQFLGHCVQIIVVVVISLFHCTTTTSMTMVSNPGTIFQSRDFGIGKRQSRDPGINLGIGS